MSGGSCSNFGRTENIVALFYFKKKKNNQPTTNFNLPWSFTMLEKEVQNTTGR